MNGEVQDRSDMAGGIREARLSHDGDGEPIGAAVFFTPEDLRDLGVDPTGTTTVVVSVENGRLCVRSGGVTDDDSDDREQAGGSGNEGGSEYVRQRRGWRSGVGHAGLEPTRAVGRPRRRT